MSDKISLSEFEAQVDAELLSEAREINKRRNALRKLFLEKANLIGFTEDTEDEIRETVLDYATHFFESVDYEYSNIKEGNVQIWEQSTC